MESNHKMASRFQNLKMLLKDSGIWGHFTGFGVLRITARILEPEKSKN